MKSKDIQTSVKSVIPETKEDDDMAPIANLAAEKRESMQDMKMSDDEIEEDEDKITLTRK